MPDSTRREFNADLIALAAVPALGQDRAISSLRRKDWEPAYLRLEASGELAERARALWDIYNNCHLCPRQCRVNRLKREKGVCQSISRAKVYSAHPHYGEERPLVGRRGSGTIFFSQCNLRCVFCQNWEINHRGDGSFASDDALARMMIALQDQGCHNINLVTPTHCVPNIVNALRTAIRLGLRVPLVYNCGGYESLDVVKMLDGIVDIYLPDYKYTDPEMSNRYSPGAKDYPEIAAAAIEEMHRQVGEGVVDENGIALRGLMIRHLVMPNNIAGTDKFVEWVARKLTPSTYVNIMGQYRPAYRSREYPDIARPVTRAEHRQAIAWARQAGLTRLDGA